MQSSQDYKINRYIFLAIILVFASILLWSLIEFFTAFLAAIMFYVLSKPSIEYLQKKRNWAKASIATLIIVVTFFIILLPIGLLVTMLYNKIIVIAQNPAVLTNAIKHFGQIIQQKYHINIISSSMDKIQTIATTIVSSVLNSSINFFSTISMMYFFLYFMITNTGRLEAGIILYLPFKRNKLELFGNELKSHTISNAIGVPLISVIQGVLSFIAYSIAGVNEAGFWAVVTGVANIIPIVGTGLIWIPTAIYLFAQGHTWQGFFILSWGVLVIAVADNALRFLLAKKMANVHPLITVLGVIIGLRNFGITGLIFGPLIISYFFILLKIYYVEYQKPIGQKSKPTASPYYLFGKKTNKRK